MALAKTAQRLIAKHGRAATLVQLSGTPADAAAPWDADGSETTTSIDMVFTEQAGTQDQPTNTGTGTVTALIAGLSAASIETGDKIIDGDITWQVLSADPIKPGATLFIWKVKLGR